MKINYDALVKEKWQGAQNRTWEIITKQPVDWAEVMEIIIEALRKDFKFYTMADTHDLYVFDESQGIWVPQGEEVVAQAADRILRKLSSHHITEIIGKLKRRTFIDRARFNPQHLIAFNNTVLDIDNWLFLEHSWANMLTRLIPITYDSTAVAPHFTQFIEEVTNCGDRNTLLEWMGYCLLNMYLFHNALILLGEGENGKSVFLNTLRVLLGESNCSNHSLFNLTTNPFAAGELYGKTANIYPELSDKEIKDTRVFKQLTGGDYGNHRVMYKKSINFINTAKLLFSCNILPAFREDTIAIWRRLHKIVFPHRIPKDQQDPDLLAKLTTEEEKSGILNLMLISLMRLLERGSFENAISIERSRDEYILDSDIIHAFADNCCVIKERNKISKDKLFRSFCMYARAVNRPPKQKGVFTRQLYLWLPEIWDKQLKFEGKNKMFWINVALRDDFDAYLDTFIKDAV